MLPLFTMHQVYNMFAHKAAAGLIKPEAVPTTKGAAAQHSLFAYLQTQDWMLLQSMSLNPRWIVGVHGYEPVPALDPMAPEELLRFMSCNCHGDCSTQWCSCKKNSVQCSMWNLQRNYMQELHQ